MQKYLLYCLMIILLTGCYQSSASLLGPAITAGTSGNIYQAGLTYGTNIVVEETTGKTTSEHFLKFITSHPSITCAIPATSRIDHMKENMTALYGNIPNEKERNKLMQEFIDI